MTASISPTAHESISPAHGMLQSAPLHGGTPITLIEPAWLLSVPRSGYLRAHAVPHMTRHKPGTGRTTQHWPPSTNTTRRPRRSPAIPTIKALAAVQPAALHQQTQQDRTKPCARRAGRMLLCRVKLLAERGCGGFLSRLRAMVMGRSERVNPAARTVTPAPATSPSPKLRGVAWWPGPVSRCFRVDPLAPAHEAAGTTRKGAG